VNDAVPPALLPPAALALAKSVESIPPPRALPGGCLYEPKWDGFRVAIFTGPGGATLWSRQGKDLTRYFPDLVAAAEEHIPSGCVVDGEALIWSNERLDFGALQQRMTTTKRTLAGLVNELPASFAAFDLLSVAGHDTRDAPLSGRRELLEELAAGWSAPLNLSPATPDRNVAETWFEDMTAAGIEGLVIKGLGQRYEGGQRQWLKVKHRETIDVVCGAVIGSRNRPEAVVAGLPIDGELRIVGRSVPLKSVAAKLLADQLQPPAGPHPWPERVRSTALDRFNADRGDTELTLVEPLVVEVTADVAWSGKSFRHPLRFLRPRPELDPDDVGFPAHLPG
jgi:ATP-dependent DNA ligase